MGGTRPQYLVHSDCALVYTHMLHFLSIVVMLLLSFLLHSRSFYFLFLHFLHFLLLRSYCAVAVLALLRLATRALLLEALVTAQ